MTFNINLTQRFFSKATIFVFLIIQIFNSCKSSCSCDDKYKTLTEDAKQWFWFKDGSWFVYRCVEDTSILDTLTVVSKDDKSSNKFCNDGGGGYASAQACSEVLSVNLEHSNGKYFPGIVDSSKAGRETYRMYYPHGYGQFMEFNSFHRGYLPVGNFIALPPIIGEELPGDYRIKDTLSITISGKRYYNTVHSVRTYLPDVADGIHDIWWAKDVGLIKLVKNPGVRIGMTWELMESHILK